MARGIQGLRGLRGLGDLSEGERNVFYSRNASILNKYNDNPILYAKVADRLYNNKKFIDRFGEAAFDKMNDGTAYSYNIRNNIYKDQVVTDALNTLSPFRKDGKRDNTKGLGENWEKAIGMTTDGRLKLLESISNGAFLTHEDFEKRWNTPWLDKIDKVTSGLPGIGNVISLYNKIKNKEDVSVGDVGLALAGSTQLPQYMAANLRQIAMLKEHPTDSKVGALLTMALGKEAGKQHDATANQKVFDSIYNDDIKQQTQSEAVVTQTAKNYDGLLNMSDNQMVKTFIKEITPGSYKDKNGNPNMGISEYASHYGDGTDISQELSGLTVDDMRKIVAKKRAYEALLSPGAANTALNNEAKQYIYDHQGAIKTALLAANDVMIASMSYTADKVNGVAESGRLAEDLIWGKPTVYVDSNGEVLDPKKVSIKKGRNGLYYKDADGKILPVYKEQLSRSALHQMGKEYDGSDIEGAFGADWLSTNPRFWSRAEQFGTLDADKQKQYEKLGSSPYQIAWEPGSEGNILYEAGKMVSFGIADRALELIPFGIGKIGKGLSTLSKTGKAVRGLGKVLDTTGKLLTTESKVGRVLHGTVGALGISYAYSRGSFQETLEKNLANLEKATQTSATNELFNRYNEDKEFKAYVDNLVNQRAEKEKVAKLSLLKREGNKYIWDEKTESAQAHENAQKEVVSELVRQEVEKKKQSKDYAEAQQKAIEGAGNTALLTFLPEAVKYGYVNTLGYRKFMYQNPNGMMAKVNKSLKGITEITTKEGRQRLATGVKKFATTKDKWNQLGKTAVSQFWGGAWTNGTDDMQVEAAEQINDDSYRRYLDAYQNGEASASTYGFIDGIYSYMQELRKSLGEEHTWRAAEVGGLGSITNFMPQFSNIARLATKKGREEYKNNFWREAVKDDKGNYIRNEDNSIKYKNLGKWHNLGAQANYLLQNGVLNTYYANKQSEEAQQNHVDYVNRILDKEDDFKEIERLVAANMAAENTKGKEDTKTTNFVKALLAMHTLNNLANNSDDAATMSSVVQNAKKMISQASQLSKVDFEKGEESPLTEEETKNFISQYYANNPELPQNMYNDRQALINIGHNAQKLVEADEALNKAEEEISKIENNKGVSISPEVRLSLLENQALDGHFRERKEKMQQEIDDPSTEDKPSDPAIILASIGGRENAEALIKVYDRQLSEFDKAYEEQKEKSQKLDENLVGAEDELMAAKKRNDSDAVLKAEKAYKEAKANLEASKSQEAYLQDLRTMTEQKGKDIRDSLKDAGKEEKEAPVLTADEIFALDPITRARMMKERNRNLYSKEQQAEIEKLEKTLLMKDADALNKIQDIATLTNRIETNKDAYARIADNPVAAEAEFRNREVEAAELAENVINQINAEATVSCINDFDEKAANNKDVTKEGREAFVYWTLRRLNSSILGMIDTDGLLPQYSQQIKAAKDWCSTVETLSAVIDNAEKDKGKDWVEQAFDNINPIVESSKDKADLLAKLEQVIKDNEGTITADDFEYILEGMENYGYQRDATVIENRKKKKQREEEAKAKKDIEKKRAEEAAKAAAQSAEEKDAANQKAIDDGNVDMDSSEDVDLFDEGSEDSEASAGQSSTEENNTEKSKTGSPIEIDVTSAGQLMDDSVPEGNIKLGRTVVKGSNGELQQVPITVEKKDGKITFSAEGESTKITVDPKNFESTAETKESKENTPFEATSIEKKDGEWYLNGNFAGDKTETQVKAKDLNLDKTIKENEVSLKDIDPTSAENITVLEDGTVAGETPSLEQQAEEAKEPNKEVHLVESQELGTDISTSSAQEEETNNLENEALSGNAMSRYEPRAIENGIEKRKVGNRGTNDSMNHFYAWMDAAGIKLQNIIDFELAKIIQRNPEAEVKYMYVKPDVNAVHDDHMKNHIMLVLDYDDSINKGITKIHDDSNGGVIESSGKKYLVVGVLGFAASNNAQHELWDLMHWTAKEKGGLELKSKRAKFFKEHPNERFFVVDGLSTKVKPNTQISGYIVKQLENDESQGSRSIVELLNDKERNPHERTLDNIAWGIQKGTQFLVIGASADKVMAPSNKERNMGGIFALAPACNGKFVPLKIAPLKYQEMKDGALSSKVEDAVSRLLNPDTEEASYKDAIAAIDELCRIFYLRKGMQDIHRKGKTVTLEDGKNSKTFDLDSPEERAQFKEAFRDMNPLVNITAEVLGNTDLIKEYAEAGALNTDAALFGTAGSSYQVYALNSEGQMIKPANPSNPSSNTGDSSFRNNKHQIIYNHQFYVEENGEFSINGNPVTDENLIKQLQYHKRIEEGMLSPVKEKGTEDYYVLSTGDNPEVIKVDKNSKKVTEVEEKEAKALIAELKAKKEAELREKAAKEALLKEKGNDNQGPTSVENTQAEVDYAHPENSIQISSTKEGLRYIYPITDALSGVIDVGRTYVGWGEVNGLSYYIVPIAGRVGDNRTYWFKDKLNEKQKKLIELYAASASIIDPDIILDIISGKKLKPEVLQRMNKVQEDHDTTISEHPLSEEEIKSVDRSSSGTVDTVVKGALAYLKEAALNSYAKYCYQTIYERKYGIGSFMKEHKKKEEKTSELTPEDLPFFDASSSEELDKASTQTFQDLANSKEYKNRLLVLLMNKFGKKSWNAKDYESDLKKNNIKTEGIGTSKADIESWIKTIEDCR